MQNLSEKHIKHVSTHGVMTLAYVICAVLYFGVYIYLAYNGTADVRWGWVILALYIVTVGAFYALYVFVFRKKAVITEDDIKNVSEITRDILVKINMPAAICDAIGRIIWHNERFVALFDGQVQYGKMLDNISSLDYKKAVNSLREDGVTCTIGSHTLAARAYPVCIEEKRYNVMLFTDNTELYRAWEKISEEETQIAYIVIDNLAEIMQYVKEKSRTASAQIENILSGWAESVGGVLKEFERDKFIFVFHRCHLQEFVDEKFDVINKIRDVRMGEGSQPVTVSVGVSGVDGSLADKEKAARAALDMALQRGGDQAAVKYPTEMVFFGGKTKTVQKRTKVRARVFVTELVHHISESSRVLVMGHARADMDSLGACLGVAKLARFCGVDVNIVADRTDGNMRKFFDKLDSMKGYSDIVIDRTEALELNSSDTLLVIVDVNNRDFFESPDLFASASRTVVIDHHIKKDEYETTFSYIEPSASSACEILAEMLEQVLSDGELTKDEADILLAGMLLDTRLFTRNTGSRTFGAAQYLRNQGAVPSDARKLFAGSFTEFEREARFESKMLMYRSHLVIAVNDCDDNEESDRVSGAKVADKMLELEGVEASFSVLRIDEDVYVSARSAGKINVQIIMGYLGGGGGYDSSAAQMRGCSLEQGVKNLKQAIDKYYSED